MAISEDVKMIATLKSLTAKLREVQAQEYELTEEIQRILGGEPGLSSKLKQLESHFDRLWCERYAKGQHGRYVWAYVRDRPQLKRMLKSLEVEDIEQRMVNYLRNEDAYYLRSRHSFGIFVATINSHADPAERPASCQGGHTPACGSRSECTRRTLNDGRIARGEALL